MSTSALPPSLLPPREHSLRVIMTNIPGEQASTLASALVRERMAACVNILPGVQSCYVWEGLVVEETEHTLLIKTDEEALERCTRRLIELHPHAVPEVLVWRPEQVLESYARWAKEVTTSESASGAKR